MISGMVKAITGSYKIVYHPEGKDGPEYNLDFAPPWRRFNMIEELESKLNVKFPPGTELHTAETQKFLSDLCTKVGVDCSEPRTNARLLDKVRRDPVPSPNAPARRRVHRVAVHLAQLHRRASAGHVAVGQAASVHARSLRALRGAPCPGPPR